jgi:hypothetical protein
VCLGYLLFLSVEDVMGCPGSVLGLWLVPAVVCDGVGRRGEASRLAQAHPIKRKAEQCPATVFLIVKVELFLARFRVAYW